MSWLTKYYCIEGVQITSYNNHENKTPRILTIQASGDEDDATILLATPT